MGRRKRSRPAGSASWTLVVTALLPSLIIYSAYLAGLISSPDLPRRSERLQPARFTTLCAVAVYPLLRGVEAPALSPRLF